jgi:hypothetical protein
MTPCFAYEPIHMDLVRESRNLATTTRVLDNLSSYLEVKTNPGEPESKSA